LVEYDVIVDDTPTSPNLKEQAWGVLVQMMPFLSRMPVPPQVYLELLKYSPLPQTVVAKIDELIQSAPKPPNPQMLIAQGRASMDQARGQLYQAQAQKTMAEAAQGNAQAQAENARTHADVLSKMMEAEKTKATVENLRSAAILNLSKAGVTHRDSNTDQVLAVLEILDTIVGWHQNSMQAQLPQPTNEAPAMVQ